MPSFKINHIITKSICSTLPKYKDKITSPTPRYKDRKGGKIFDKLREEERWKFCSF